MSYPSGLTLHAAHPGSVSYGRTTLRPLTPPSAALSTTERSRPETQRNPATFLQLLRAWPSPCRHLAPPGWPARAVVRTRARLGRFVRSPRPAAHRTALRRPGAPGDRRIRPAEAARADGTGRPGGVPDAAARGGRKRGRAAGAARLAGVGRRRPRSDGRRRRRPDHRTRAAGMVRLAGGRRLAAAPEPGCEVEARLPSFTGFTQCGGAGEKGASQGPGTLPGGRAACLSLVRLVAAAATECHRARLFHAKSPGGAGNAGTQPFCFS